MGDLVVLSQPDQSRQPEAQEDGAWVQWRQTSLVRNLRNMRSIHPFLKTCWRCSVAHVSFDLLALIPSKPDGNRTEWTCEIGWYLNTAMLDECSLGFARV